MKKIFLLSCILMCCLFTFGQTLSPSSTSIESGSVVTITGVGESSSAYFSNISIVTGITSSSPNAFGSNWVSIESAYEIQTYNSASQTPTSFKIKITNGHPDYNYTITFTILTNIQTLTGTQTNVPKTVTLTVNKPIVVTTFYNDAKSQTFYKNNCGTGFESDPVSYSVPANKYSASTKQAANALAQAEIDANGQNKANTEGVCKQVYYNTEVSASFTKNDCGGNSTPGPAVNYIVPANKHKSLTSQADADDKAQTDVNNNGQSYANANGTCIAQPYIRGVSITNGGSPDDFTIVNASPGETYQWFVPNSAIIVSGQNTANLSVILKRMAGTTPHSVQIRAEVTNSLGIKRNLIHTVKVRSCGNCPEI